MKKLLCLFAVLALTAPVMAADPNVTILCEDKGSGLVEVSLLVEPGLNPDGDPGLVRGIALDIETVIGNDATIDGISGYATGATPADSTQIPAGYSIFMGSVIFAADPNLVADFGDPVAPGSYPDTAGQLFSKGITVEMGSLYAEGDQAPDSAWGVAQKLFDLQLGANGETETVLEIAANTTRGGCVMEDGDSANVVSSGCTITFEDGCVYVAGNPRGACGDTITAANVAAWVAAGSPDVWCCPYQPCGDANGDGFVNPQDYLAIAAKIGTSAAVNPREDVNHDGFVNPQDYLTVGANIGQGDGVICPPLP
jgi:dockerin type I repeat protein